MKKLALFTILMMIFATGAVFACGSSCDKDKDKDEQGFTVDAQYLCGGDKGDKPAPEPEAMCGTCGCTKSKPEPKPEPKPEEGSEPDKEPEADEEEPDDQCGGDKGDKPAPEPEAMCSGSGCGRDKKEIVA
jgi:hypothetical protein